MEVSVMSINNKSEEQLIPGIVHADSGSENWCGLNTMAIDLPSLLIKHLLRYRMAKG